MTSVVAILAAGLGAPRAQAAVLDLTLADVTTRSFSVIWVSDEPVSDARVRIFQDAGGMSEITASLAQTLVSGAFPPAHDLGIVKVQVRGLSAGETVSVQAESSGASGMVLEPAGPPFLPVTLATRIARTSPTGGPIVNDLVLHDLFGTDGTGPVAGGLLLLEIPGVSAYPLSAFVGGGFGARSAVINLNNLFTAGSGETAELADLAVLALTELRGARCPALIQHRLLRFRRAPAHEELAQLGVRLSELEPAVPCFAADTVCDDEVNVLDAQRVLNVLGQALGSCAYNPDLDLDASQALEAVDAERVFDRLGETAPFSP